MMHRPAALASSASQPTSRRSLALFRTPDDGDETDLLLDRAGSPRARWSGSGALPDAETIVADAARVAQFPVAP